MRPRKVIEFNLVGSVILIGIYHHRVVCVFLPAAGSAHIHLHLDLMMMLLVGYHGDDSMY